MWQTFNKEAILPFFADDCVYEDVALGIINSGKGEVGKFIEDSLVAFSDFKVETKSVFSSDNKKLVSEWVISGIHTGDFPGLPATGKSFSVRGVSIIEFQDGKIRRITDYWNLASFLEQVGAMKL